MPRPIKWRNVCALPKSCKFGPMDKKGDSEVITMTVDEFETIRLIDHLGYNQTECAENMNVARTTVQGIYLSARKKIALSLVEGKNIVIEGGEYRICGECKGKKGGCHSGDFGCCGEKKGCHAEEKGCNRMRCHHQENN